MNTLINKVGTRAYHIYDLDANPMRCVGAIFHYGYHTEWKVYNDLTGEDVICESLRDAKRQVPAIFTPEAILTDDDAAHLVPERTIDDRGSTHDPDDMFRHAPDCRCPSCEENLIPFCLTDDCDNPACEGDTLCLPCAQLRDAQSVRQEDDDSWSNRGGGTYEPFHARLERTYREVARELDRDSLAEHLSSVAGHIGSARAMLGTSGQPTSASERRMADDELADALARCGLLIHTLRMAVAAAGLLLALSLGSASAADYTPTAPIGCAITHYWSQDDLSAIAVCAGSYTVHKEAGPLDDWNDIPYAIGSTRIGPDAQGEYHDWTLYD